MPYFVEWLKRQEPDTEDERINRLILAVRQMPEDIESWSYQKLKIHLINTDCYYLFIQAVDIMGQYYEKHVAITYPNSILAD